MIHLFSHMIPTHDSSIVHSSIHMIGSISVLIITFDSLSYVVLT